MQHRPLLHRPLAACLVGLALLGQAAEAQTVTLLPGATGRGLSRDGVAVTGWATGQPFVWQQGAGFTALSGSLYNTRAVSDLGATVVGMVDEPGSGKQGSGAWAAATGGWLALGALPGFGGCPGYGEALAVSSDGVTVGGELFQDCNLKPYVWTRLSGYTVLPMTGGFGSVEAVSGDGQVAGGWDTHPTLGFRRAAFWDAAHNESFPLVSPANPNGGGEVVEINEDGTAYAGLDDSVGAYVMRGGVFTDLGVTPDNPRPTGISDDGNVVVGSWGSPFVGGLHPWVWTDAGGAQDADAFFAAAGVSFPAGVSMAAMLGVSRDGLTFLAAYDDSGPGPDGVAHIQLPADTTWTDLGSALGGVSGDPLLVGSGDLSGGSSVGLDLSNAAPSALSGLFLGTDPNTPAPFKGGTLVPVPSLLVVFVNTSPTGTIPLAFSWPAGVPAGVNVYVQWAISDAAAVAGVALSNAIVGVTP